MIFGSNRDFNLLVNINRELLKDVWKRGGQIGGVSNWWGEISDRPAYAMLSRGAPAVEDEQKVAELLAGDNYVWHGEHPDPNAPALFKSVKGWYTKTFGDHAATKIILGSPS